MREFVPLLPGVAPFGMIAGVAALNAGMNPIESVLNSLIVYAGSSQLVAAQMLGAGSPWWLIVAVSAIVNLRFAMYSAAMREPLRVLRGWHRPFGAYIMTDHAFAVCLRRFQTLERERWAGYYLGGSVLMWVVWIGATAVGALLGARLPPEWQLEWTVPLVFLAFMMAAIRNRSTLVAAMVGGAVAVLLANWPYRLGLVVGSLAGIAAGMVFDQLEAHRRKAS